MIFETLVNKAETISDPFRGDNVNAILSKREIEVLQSLKKGYFYKEVGVDLNISVDTVKRHLRNIYNKLDVRNKTEALNKLFG